ncbi:hypothetical protein GCM10008164_00950 [Achromobacter xylosoxidans]|nr:hypothetical protein GCM10008164_00950 [Achromobacter xylosoxidans]
MRMSAKSLPADVRKLVAADAALKRFQALGRLPKDKMNNTEKAYSLRLEAMRQRGEVLGWLFHPIRVRLADATYYEVDFLVLHADMRIAIHEVKGGHTTDKGQLKIKLCAEVLPWFVFYKAVKQPESLGGGWKLEEY